MANTCAKGLPVIEIIADLCTVFRLNGTASGFVAFGRRSPGNYGRTGAQGAKFSRPHVYPNR